MILKTKLFGHVYEFKSIREVMAKANEEKSGDKLAGIAAETGESGRQGGALQSDPERSAQLPRRPL